MSSLPLAPDQSPFPSEPVVLAGMPARVDDPARGDWFAYYGVCLAYISSLHNQFIAILSIQGALAIGCLAALDAFTETPALPALASTLGWLALAMELALTWIAFRLVRQHSVICQMLARVEEEKLGLADWASMKALLGARENRLFTSPATRHLTVGYGLILAVGLLVVTLVVF